MAEGGKKMCLEQDGKQTCHGVCCRFGPMEVWSVLKNCHGDSHQSKPPLHFERRMLLMVFRKQTRLGLGTNELLEMLTAREQSCNPWKRPNLPEKWDTDEATKWGVQDGEGQRCTKQSWTLKALGTSCPSGEKGRRSELK